MARTETSKFSQSTPITGVASSVSPRSNAASASIAKDQLQRNDIIKTEFTAREGTYRISSLIDNLGKLGGNTCLNEPVKITLITRAQAMVDGTSEASSRRSSSATTNNHASVGPSPNDPSDGELVQRRQSSLSDAIESDRQIGSMLLTEILAFNVGRELLVYEFAEPTQPNFGEPIDHRVYKQNHQPTCHDIIHDAETNILHVLVGFSKGQVQYINMQTKEQKVFNEASYLDKTKVTCIKWLSSPRTSFAVSYASGSLYIFDEQLNHQRDTNVQPTYSIVKDEERNYSISYTKTRTKQARNPLARWSIGSGSINQFAFSPDRTLLAVVSQDGFLRIFDFDKMDLVAYMRSYFGGLLCVCWSPDGKYLATGGEDDFLTLFSLDVAEQSSRVLCRGYGHTSWISAIAFDPYVNATTYYSAVRETTSSSSLNHDDENGFATTTTTCDASSCVDRSVPSLFYRLGSVGQDNRLCLWDITEDILKLNQINPSLSPLISTLSNGFASFLSDTTALTSVAGPITTTKSSFTSITSRLSFSRHSSKVPKSNSALPDNASVRFTNGVPKKGRKSSLNSNASSGSKSGANDSPHGSLSISSNNSSSSRRTNVDLTKSSFGTSVCPKLDDIQVIEPIVSELISHERLNGIYFGETCLLTSSQDGIIAIWKKPSSLLTSRAAGEQATSTSALINSNSHQSALC